MSNNKNIGKKIWAISGGNIPFHCNGSEPEFTSRDWISVLNTSAKEATITLVLFYEDCDPVEGFEYKIAAKRVKKIRFNDLIDPFPVPLQKPFGCVIRSSVNIIIQFNRMDTGDSKIALMGTMAYTEK